MNSNDGAEWNMDGLDQILKAFKGPTPQGKVGILGRTNQREDANSNATIGFKHEFGDPLNNLPIRSFLRQPIAENMQRYLNKTNAFSKAVLKNVIASGSIFEWVKLITYEAEGVVFDAFNTGGFGKWKPSNMDRKKNKQTLVETQQLRNSIVSEVK